MQERSPVSGVHLVGQEREIFQPALEPRFGRVTEQVPLDILQPHEIVQRDVDAAMGRARRQLSLRMVEEAGQAGE